MRGQQSRDPKLRQDQSVFGIKQGVAISLYARNGKRESSINTAEIRGAEASKYAWLERHTCGNAAGESVTPQPKMYSFRANDIAAEKEFDQFMPINEIFEVGNVGYQTHRDDFVIDVNRASLSARMKEFKESRGVLNELVKKFDLLDKDDWSVLQAHKLARADTGLTREISPTLYRPFDTRFICYASYLLDRDRREVMRQMLEENIGLLVSKVFDEHEYTSAFVTNTLVESKAADRTRGSYVYPLNLPPLVGR